MAARGALIVGLGLIGGSIGMALRSRGWRVSFDDPNVSLDEARSRGAADAVGGDADITILATPVDVAAARLPRIEGRVTSVCSVMSPLRAVGGEEFVAGHPMAGTEQRGLAAASIDLFREKKWFLDRRDTLVEELVADCGAVAEFVDAEEHDRAVALVSHLPQLLSTALAAYLAENESALRFGGSGLRTFLRLAGSDASVWGPVLDANAANIAPHADAVAKLVKRMLDGDIDAFAKAQRVYEQLRTPSTGS